MIFTASSIPKSHAPGLGLPFVDKIVHFFEFGIFGLLLMWALVGSNRTNVGRGTFLLALLGGVLWGGLDEVHQMFVPGRNTSVYDFLADATGVVVFQLVFLLIAKSRDSCP